jgi:hypothetical protein
VGRDFVQTYGKDRIKVGDQVDKKLLWKAYRENFHNGHAIQTRSRGAGIIGRVRK